MNKQNLLHCKLVKIMEYILILQRYIEHRNFSHSLVFTAMTFTMLQTSQRILGYKNHFLRTQASFPKRKRVGWGEDIQVLPPPLLANTSVFALVMQKRTTTQDHTVGIY